MPRTGTAEELASLIRERGPAVVLTGAGMSTESGIPDFRSAQGIWAEVDPFEVASIDAFRRDPVRVWQWYGPRITASSPPSRTTAIARSRSSSARARARGRHAEHRQAAHARRQRGRRGGARLDQRGSSASRAARPRALDEVLDQLRVREAPECPSCGAILKPGVVMFGELLPVDAIARAERLAGEAGVLSPSGRPSRSGPSRACPTRPFAPAGRSRSSTDEPTPYDDAATLLLRGRAAAALGQVARILMPGLPPCLLTRHDGSSCEAWRSS